MEKQKSITNKISFLLLSILFLGTVSVFAGNVFVSEEGLRSDNYYSGEGSLGKTQNVTYKTEDGSLGVLIFEDGIFIGVVENDNLSSENWWNSNWNLRKDITITETSGTTLYNYSVLLNVVKELEMNWDFSDLIFTSNNISIPYYIEAFKDGIGLIYPELTSHEPMGYDEREKTDMTSYFAFEDTGSNVVDEQGFNNMVSVGVTKSSDGILGNGYYFDGDDYIQDADYDYWAGTGVKGATVWVKIASNPASNSIVFRGFHDPTNTDFALTIDSTGYIKASRGNVGIVGYDVTSASPMPLNEWVMLSMSYDNTKIELWVNGISQGTTLASGGGSAGASTGICIGCGVFDFQSDRRLFFTGWIDELSFYDRDFTDEELQAQYDQGLLNGLISSYNFDIDATDEHGTNHGTVYGGMIPTTGNGGIRGEAYYFTGSSSSYIESASVAGISGNDPRTLMGWIKMETTVQSVLMGIGVGNTNQEFAMGESGGYFSIVGYANDNTATTMPFSLDTWYHLTATFDGIRVKGYVNGVEVINELESYATVNSKLLIGKRNGWGTGTNGQIDQVEIYDRALTSAEILKKYNAQSVDVYVKVPQLNALAETTIQMYYNNSLAMNQSNEFTLDTSASSQPTSIFGIGEFQ